MQWFHMKSSVATDSIEAGTTSSQGHPKHCGIFGSNSSHYIAMNRVLQNGLFLNLLKHCLQTGRSV